MRKKKSEPVYYTARHLLQVLNNLDDALLDVPLMLLHGKRLTKPNLVNGIIPSPIPVDQEVVEGKQPALLVFADFSSRDGKSCVEAPIVPVSPAAARR